MIFTLNLTYSDMSNRNVILIIAILLSFSSYSQEDELPALRLNDVFSNHTEF